MSLNRDYILRIAEQLAQALASVLKLRKKGAHSAAIGEVESAAAGIAGLDFRMAASVDAATLAGHVQEPARLEALARLFQERAEISREQGDAGENGWRRKAVEVWLEAGARGGVLDAAARAAIAAYPADGLTAHAQGLRAMLGP
jgi:hypothetical protein